MRSGTAGFHRTRAAAVLVLWLLGSARGAAELPALPATDEQFFTDTVLPILRTR